jgi:cell division septation protein DedD
MTMRDASTQNRPGNRLGSLLRLLSAGLLGTAAALLVACGSSGKGLIPTGDAGPLQSDFEAVAQAAENGDGSCTATAEAIRKTEQDFNTLPATVDAGLRNTLNRGIANLRTRALSLCAQPLSQTTSTSTSPRTTSTSTQTTSTTPTVTQTTSTQTTPTTTTPTTSGPGGGTPAPSPGAGEVSPGASGGQGGGSGVGEAPPGAGGAGSGGAGAGAGGAGQEGGK